MLKPLWKAIWRFLKKPIVLPYDPAIPVLSIYLEKIIIRKDTCTPTFTAALFPIAKTWKQPRCPLTDEWIKKMWYIYTMEHYSAIKWNEIGSVVETWIYLETVIQSGHQEGKAAGGGGVKNWEIGIDMYTMEYYSAIKKNEIMSLAATWMDLEIIILSEVRERKTNNIYHLYVESKV